MMSQLLLSTATLLFVLDLIGTFVFALSGAMAGVKRKLDLFGVLVVGLIVVLAGWSGVRATLDAAIVIALIGFVGTVAYATYVERGDPQ